MLAVLAEWGIGFRAKAAADMGEVVELGFPFGGVITLGIVIAFFLPNLYEWMKLVPEDQRRAPLISLPRFLSWRPSVAFAVLTGMVFAASRVLSHRPARDNLPLQGLGASAARSGFGTDGALYSLGPAAPNRDDWLPDFPTTRRFIVNGESRFPRDCRLSGKSMAYFGKFLALARKHGIGVTVLVPPLPGQIHDAAGGLDYMHQAAERMRAMGVTVFDFLDGRVVDARDDEFYDGIHGGEAVLARVFLAMAADPAWADRVDTATARKSLAQSQGSPRQLAPRLD